MIVKCFDSTNIFKHSCIEDMIRMGMSIYRGLEKKLLLNCVAIWQRAIQGVRVGHTDISYPDHDTFRKSERCGNLGGCAGAV